MGRGPTSLVPTGFPCLLIKATEFSLKFKEDPSFLITYFLVLTTNARNTPPFRTLDVFFDLFLSFWIETTIISPVKAYLFLNPPKTFMHFTTLAPELSETFNKLSC